MKRIEPKNETYLAAELAFAGKALGVRPERCAIIAANVCALGRRYARLSERLCGGEEVWGQHPEAQDRIEAATLRREKIRAKVAEMLKPIGTLDSDGSGLFLVAVTEIPAFSRAELSSKPRIASTALR